jgi:hypothetical protein
MYARGINPNMKGMRMSFDHTSKATKVLTGFVALEESGKGYFVAVITIL